MKKSVLVFPRDTYISKSDGTTRTYVCRDEVRAVMGQAKDIRFEVIGYHISSSAKISVKLWESADPDLRPSEVVPDGSPFFSSSAITTPRPGPMQITGPFCDNVEMTVDIEEDGTPTTQQDIDMEIWATLIIEE